MHRDRRLVLVATVMVAPTVVGAQSPSAQAIAVGAQHYCVLDTRGRVLCWGSNRGGESGQVTGDIVETPTVVALPEQAIAIATANLASCALTVSSWIYCWGEQVGRSARSAGPREIRLPARPVSLVGAGSHMCAVASNGEVWCWSTRLRGIGGPGAGGSPARITSRGARAVVIGLSVCFLDVRGAIRCRGLDSPDFQSSSRGVRASRLALGPTLLCAQTGYRRVVCWEDVHQSEFRLDVSGAARLRPPVPIRELSVGGLEVCVIGTDDRLFCQTDIWSGEFRERFPGRRFRTAAIGPIRSCAIDTAGGLHCWDSEGVARFQAHPQSEPQRVDLPSAQ